MKIFLDTLNLDLIKKYSHLGILTGVTTNPTFAKRFGMDNDLEMVAKVRKALGKGEIHLEAFGGKAEEIIKHAQYLTKRSKDHDLVFKIPFGQAGIKAAKILLRSKKKTNLHLIYSLNQALLAASIGSTYICPLLGRLDDVGHDAISNLKKIKKGFEINFEKTQIMVSSVRHPQHVLKAYSVGVEAITIPPDVLEKMFYHPMTDEGVCAFKDDIELIRPIAEKKINKTLIVEEKASLKEGLSLMVAQKSGAVAVCSQKKLVGVFTAGDLKRLIQKGKKYKLDEKISKFMRKKPITVGINETVQKAKELFHKFKIDQLVVVDNGTLVGILDIKEVE